MSDVFESLSCRKNWHRTNGIRTIVSSSHYRILTMAFAPVSSRYRRSHHRFSQSCRGNVVRQDKPSTTNGVNLRSSHGSRKLEGTKSKGRSPFQKISLQFSANIDLTKIKDLKQTLEPIILEVCQRSSKVDQTNGFLRIGKFSRFHGRRP